MQLRAIGKAIFFCITFTIILVGSSFLKNYLPVASERWAHGILGIFAAFITTYFFLKYDKKSFAWFGLKPDRKTLVKFCAGVLTGILMMGILALSVIHFSGFRIEANTENNMVRLFLILHFFLMTLPLLPLAFMEELAFRGYPLVLLKEKTGLRNSVIITSFLFGLYHIANGWTFLNALMGAGVWGIIYAVAAIYSNGIAFPTGIHYAANLTTAAFGTSQNYNLWILKQEDGSSAENYQGSFAESIIPNICLLILGVILMELLCKKMKTV